MTTAPHPAHGRARSWVITPDGLEQLALFDAADLLDTLDLDHLFSLDEQDGAA